MSTTAEAPTLGPVLQRFFMDHLIQQRHASPSTIAAYRDTFRILFAFTERRLGKRPAKLTLTDCNSKLILDFLNYLEDERKNTSRSRNARFAAIRSFMHYAAGQEPSVLAVTQAVLAIPMKRFDRPLVGFLSREQIEAILAAPDPSTWSGRRDRVMFATLYNAGARVSEITGMRIADLTLTPAAAILIRGKGRKERCVPLWRSTAKQLKTWLNQEPRTPEQPLFPNRAGGVLTRTSVSERLRLAVQTAGQRYPELTKRRVSPHIIRHYLASRTM
jgi:integrase/recombinase XerD